MIPETQLPNLHFVARALVLISFVLSSILSGGSTSAEDVHRTAKRHGELVASSDRWQIYTHLSLGCEEYDQFGNGTEHWFMLNAFFEQDVRLPAGEAFGRFFRSIVEPALQRHGLSLCGTTNVNPTSVRVHMHYEGYVHTVRFSSPQVAEGIARRSAGGDWEFQWSGHALLADALAEAAEQERRTEAGQQNVAYGEAEAWVKGSSDSNVHPPYYSEADVLHRSDKLTLYGAPEGSLTCVRASDTVRARFALRFPANASIPGGRGSTGRERYEDFFAVLWDALLQKHCEQASTVRVDHFFERERHPFRNESARVNSVELSLSKAQGGRWKVGSTGDQRTIFTDAKHIAAARAEGEFAEKEASRTERAMKIREATGADNPLALLTALMGERSSVFTQEFRLEASGVFFRSGSMKDGIDHLRLCNESGEIQRVATAVELPSDERGAEGEVDVVVSGWGVLATDECKALRTGNGNLALVWLESKRANGRWSPGLWDVEATIDLDRSDEWAGLEYTDDLSAGVRATSGLCVSSERDFRRRAIRTGLQGLFLGDSGMACGPHEELRAPRYLLQFSGENVFTLNLK